MKGEGANVVPALAIARIDVRASTKEDMEKTYSTLKALAEEGSQSEGITLHLFGRITRLPKEFDPATQHLFENVKACAETLGQSAFWRETGGVCDGNILAAKGLPTIDTLGALGGGLHTPNEYIHLDSLVARARLATFFLMKLSTGEIALNKDVR
jgi:glutamate carboxypeptidase